MIFSHYFQQMLVLPCLLIGIAFAAPISNFPSISLLEVIPSIGKLENIATRHTGELLVTSVTSNTILQVSPDGATDPVPVATIEGINATLGITELSKDAFYVIGSLLNGFSAVSGSTGIWELDLNVVPVEISLIAKFPDAQLFNGISRLAVNDTENLLIADSGTGTITRLNVASRESEVVIRDEAMTYDESSGYPIGVNGIHTFHDTAYFTNFNRETLSSVPISLIDGSATGPVQKVADVAAADDFTLSLDGRVAYVATNGPTTIIKVDTIAKSSEVLVNSTLLLSATAVALESTCNHTTLFVSCAQEYGNSTIGAVVKIEI